MTFRKWAINKLGGLDLDGFTPVQQAVILQMENDNALYRIMKNVKMATDHLPGTMMEVAMEDRERQYEAEHSPSSTEEEKSRLRAKACGGCGGHSINVDGTCSQGCC